MTRLAWRHKTRPARDAGAAWLGSDRVVRPDGRVWSWVNDVHPGYPYPEAAALWLSWAVWRAGAGLEGPRKSLVAAVRQGLVEDLVRDGAVGRNGTLYLFDTCVVVDALARNDAMSGSDVESWKTAAVKGIERFLGAGAAVLGDTRGLDGRWSTCFGPHLIKAAALLQRAGRSVGDGAFLAHAEAILTLVTRSAAAPGPTYGHALAYAAEGAWLLRVLDREVPDASLDAAAERFAAVQRGDGSIPAWMDGSGPARADTTAQAVRLWAAADPARYRASIKAGLSFLEDLRDPEGGVSYEPGSRDLNTWATVFADQAVAWARGFIAPLDWV